MIIANLVSIDENIILRLSITLRKKSYEKFNKRNRISLNVTPLGLRLYLYLYCWENTDVSDSRAK